MVHVDSVKKLVAEWLEHDTDVATREEIEALVAGESYERLDELLSTRMVFGTAGLRAEIGAGNTRMNVLTVQQAAQGLCAYAADKGSVVVVGHDHRHKSREFAQVTAAVFLSRGFRVFLFRRLIPTPVLAFSTRFLRATCGVMVTASHNPKADNGFKVYWEDGAQISSPRDAEIYASIEKNRIPWTRWDDLALASESAEDPYCVVMESYLSSLRPLRLPEKVWRCMDLKVAYTAMHGVGYETVQKAVEAFDLPSLVPVEQQVYPDPDFPTTSHPNPEEPGALDVAIAAAEKAGARYVLANDPDADRLALAERTETGWRTFTGDEIGLVFATHLAEKLFSADPRLAFLNTVVSSGMLGVCVDAWVKTGRDCVFAQTLTGFKNLSKRAAALEAEGYRVALAYEEAIGYMIGTGVLDKDGVSALVVLYEFLLTLGDSSVSYYLESIYRKYGYVSIFNTWYISTDPVQINEAFSRLASRGPDCEGVESVENLPTGLVVSFSNPCAKIIFRASGTEPKLKFYSSMGPMTVGAGPFLPQKKDWDTMLRDRVLSLANTCVDPEQLGLLLP